MGSTYVPPTFPASVASFYSNTFNFDPLVAGETITISAQLSSGQGVLNRGQVLCGWAPGTARNVALSTTGSACAILAQTIDTGTAGAVTAIVYVQGKFLVTALTASGNGLELDSAELWNVGVYVMTVEQRSGLLIPWSAFPATPGVPLPQALAPKDAAKAVKDEVDAIKAASGQAATGAAYPPRVQFAAPPSQNAPAWAIAAFDQQEQTQEQKAREQAEGQAAELQAAQQKELYDLEAKHNQELLGLRKKQQEERDQTAKAGAEALKQARPAPPNPPQQPWQG